MSVGETHIQRALTWILEQLAESPGAKRPELIERAAKEFDLTPLDEEFLYRQLTQAGKDKGPAPER